MVSKAQRMHRYHSDHIDKGVLFKYPERQGTVFVMQQKQIRAPDSLAISACAYLSECQSPEIKIHLFVNATSFRLLGVRTGWDLCSFCAQRMFSLRKVSCAHGHSENRRARMTKYGAHPVESLHRED
jgi:hypothetical protein